MSRKPLSIWEQERKQEFDKQLKEYSTECLKQIYMIATKGLDMRTRLLANQYIIDKCFGKDYKAFKDEAEQTTSNVTINLLPKGKIYQPNKDDDTEIWGIENDLDNDTEDDDWEDSIYKG